MRCITGDRKTTAKAIQLAGESGESQRRFELRGIIALAGRPFGATARANHENGPGRADGR